jgi:hypothetical protein
MFPYCASSQVTMFERPIRYIRVKIATAVNRMGIIRGSQLSRMGRNEWVCDTTQLTLVLVHYTFKRLELRKHTLGLGVLRISSVLSDPLLGSSVCGTFRRRKSGVRLTPVLDAKSVAAMMKGLFQVISVSVIE